MRDLRDLKDLRIHDPKSSRDEYTTGRRHSLESNKEKTHGVRCMVYNFGFAVVWVQDLPVRGSRTGWSVGTRCSGEGGALACTRARFVLRD